MMNVRAKLVAAVVGASTALILFLPSPAAADDPLGGLVDQTEEAIDSTVPDTTEVVEETVDTVSEVVSDPTTTDASFQDVVADSTAGVRDTVTAVGDAVGDASIETDSSAGSAYSSGGGSGDSTAGSLDGDQQRDGENGRKDRLRADEIGHQEWVWKPADRLESTWENVPVGMRVEQAAVGDESDPCHEDPALVCLGILYEMGRYAKIVTSVLGVLATTGIGVVGLMAMALALGTSGSAALVASRRRSAAAAGRG